MLNVTGNTRIFLFRDPADLRKGFEGLARAVEEHFDAGLLLSDAFFVFLNRKRDRIKVLYWDSDGLAIWFKRLEKGTFSKSHLKKSIMNRREFLMLLEGVIPKRMQHRFSLETS